MFKFVGVALGGLVVGVLVGLALFGGGVFGASSGTYHTNDEQFAGAVTFSGAVTQSATVTNSGTWLGTGIVKVSSASSTLQIGNIASGVGKGCLVLGDSGGATSSPVYVTATGATLSATTTKPAYCK